MSPAEYFTRFFHGNVITIWWTFAIEVTALSRKLLSEMEGMKEKRIYHGVRDRWKNLSLRITVLHHAASLMVPDSHTWDGFYYLPLTTMIDSYKRQPRPDKTVDVQADQGFAVHIENL